jgi:hypothetical protein
MPYPTQTWPRPLPLGECYCGCGETVSARSFFVAGHDKTAESRVILAEYGSVADFLVAHGYRPGALPAIQAVPRA